MPLWKPLLQSLDQKLHVQSRAVGLPFFWFCKWHWIVSFFYYKVGILCSVISRKFGFCIYCTYTPTLYYLSPREINIYPTFSSSSTYMVPFFFFFVFIVFPFWGKTSKLDDIETPLFGVLLCKLFLGMGHLLPFSYLLGIYIKFWHK